jgi:hypothetical protein
LVRTFGPERRTTTTSTPSPSKSRATPAGHHQEYPIAVPTNVRPRTAKTCHGRNADLAGLACMVTGCRGHPSPVACHGPARRPRLLVALHNPGRLRPEPQHSGSAKGLQRGPQVQSVLRRGFGPGERAPAIRRSQQPQSTASRPSGCQEGRRSHARAFEPGETSPVVPPSWRQPTATSMPLRSHEPPPSPPSSRSQARSARGRVPDGPPLSARLCPTFAHRPTVQRRSRRSTTASGIRTPGGPTEEEPSRACARGRQGPGELAQLP